MRIVSFYRIFFCAFIGSLFTAASTKAQVENQIDLEFDKICLIDSVDLSTQVIFYRIFDLNTNTVRNVDENLVTYTPLGTVKTCDQLEGFLPEKECWAETYCDYTVSNIITVTDPLNPCSGQLDSIIEIRTELGIMPLNYPYDELEIALQTDIQNYLTTNGIPFDSVRGNNIYGTTLTIISKTMEFSKAGCPSAGTSTYLYEVVNCVSNNYDVYRFTNGNFAIAIDENGNAVGSLPPNAVKIPCCQLCDIEESGTGTNNEEEYVELCLIDSLTDGTLIRFYRVVDAVNKSYEDYSQNYTPYGIQGTVYPCELLNINEIQDTTDTEYVEICLIDSIDLTTATQFYRIYNIKDATSVDYDQDFNTYTPTGTVVSCENWYNRTNVSCAVVNIPEHANQNGTSIAYATGTYNSLAFTVLSGTIDVTTNGVTITYPTGFSKSWTARDECSFLTQAITVDATNGHVIVGTIR